MPPLIPPQDDLSSESTSTSVSSVDTFTTCADSFDEGFHLTALPVPDSVPSVASPSIIDATNLAPGDPIDSNTIPSIIAVPSTSVSESVSAGDISTSSPIPEPAITNLNENENKIAHTTTARGQKTYTPSRFTEAGTCAATVPHHYSM